jgi:F0F1-type ATP synthase membrane subunit b/b'
MNPALLIIIALVVFLIWFAGSFLYRPIGKLFKRMYKDAKETIEQTDKEDLPSEEENK